MGTKLTARYYYWLAVAFVRKHIRIIALSSAISMLLVITSGSIIPAFSNIVTKPQRTIGMVGSYTRDTLPEAILSQLSSSFLYITPNGEIAPLLASSWETQNNGKKFILHLKKNLIWTDGTVFLPKDIVFPFKATKDVTILTNNPSMIEFEFKTPLPIFPYYLSFPVLKRPLTGVAGMYSVGHIREKNESIEELILIPNKSDIQPIVYKFYPNETQLFTAYKLSDISEMTIEKKTLADSFREWKNTLVTPGFSQDKIITLFMNVTTEILRDKDVRQAIEQAIDKQKLAELGLVVDSPIPPSSWAYNSELKKQIFDPDGARTVLKKYKTDWEKNPLIISTPFDLSEVAEFVSRSLRDVGVANSVKLISSAQDMSAFDVMLLPWNIGTDPDQYFFWHSSQIGPGKGNISQYKNVKIDKLLEDGRIKSSVEERRKLYWDFQKIITDDTPAVFLYIPYKYHIQKKVIR